MGHFNFDSLNTATPDEARAKKKKPVGHVDDSHVTHFDAPNPKNTPISRLGDGEDFGGGGQLTVRNFATHAMARNVAMLRECLVEPETDVTARALEARDQLEDFARTALFGYDEDAAEMSEAEAADEAHACLTEARAPGCDAESKRAHYMRVRMLMNKCLDDGSSGDTDDLDADENFKEMMKTYSEKAHTADLEAGATRISRNERKPGSQHLAQMPKRG